MENLPQKPTAAPSILENADAWKIGTKSCEMLMLNDFKKDLFFIGMPPLIEEAEARDGALYNGLPTVVFMSECGGMRFGHVREGGRVSPGNVFQVVDPSWLEKRQETEGALARVYLHKGITFDDGGCGRQASLVSFNPPRLVTYFVDMFTMHTTGQWRNDGLPFETGVDTPLSSSVRLEELTSDKLYTRLLLAQARVSFPATLAYMYKPSYPYKNLVPDAPIKVSMLKRLEVTSCKPVFLRDVKHFVEWQRLERVVVKPSGTQWQQCRGVSFHDARDIDAIVEAMLALTVQLHETDGILVEEFLTTMPARQVVTERDRALHRAIRASAAQSRAADAARLLLDEQQHAKEEHEAELQAVEGEAESDAVIVDNESNNSNAMPSAPTYTRLAHRLRVVVQRMPDNLPRVATITCGVGPASIPLGGHNTFAMTFDTFCEMWGVGAESKKNIYQAICHEAEQTLLAIMSHEQHLTQEERGGLGAQTDNIGMDMILTSKAGIIIPSILEVNDHDCTMQPQRLESTVPRLQGAFVRTWIHTALSRSSAYLLGGKTLAIIGLRAFGSPAALLEMAATANVTLVAVEATPSDVEEQLSKSRHALVVVPELATCANDNVKAVEAVTAALTAKGFAGINGVLGIGEACAMIAAGVAVAFKLPLACAPDALAKAHTHSTIHAHLKSMAAEWTGYSYYRPSPDKYHINTYKIGSFADVAAIEAERKSPLEFPLVMKPDASEGSFGARLIVSKADLETELVQLATELNQQSSKKGLANSLATTIVLQDFVQGSEHGVFITLYRGRIVAHAIVDYSPTELPFFAEAATAVPSTLSGDSAASLVSQAHSVLYHMSLWNGVFQVKFKYGPMYPRVVGINVSPFSRHVRNRVQQVYGYDMLLHAMCIACNVAPAPMLPHSEFGAERQHEVGILVYPKQIQNAAVPVNTSDLERLATLGVISYTPFAPTVPDSASKAFPDPVCSIAVNGPTRGEAQRHLLSVVRTLGLDMGETPMSWFIDNL